GEPVPPEEQAVIEAGEETALSHCRDLDLWLAAWSAETLGGEVEFGTAPSRIEVRVPDLPD
ncbi:MAG: sensor histidine kinase, partial [Salinirussus sp.]